MSLWSLCTFSVNPLGSSSACIFQQSGRDLGEVYTHIMDLTTSVAALFPGLSIKFGTVFFSTSDFVLCHLKLIMVWFSTMIVMGIVKCPQVKMIETIILICCSGNVSKVTSPSDYEFSPFQSIVVCISSKFSNNYLQEVIPTHSGTSTGRSSLYPQGSLVFLFFFF